MGRRRYHRGPVKREPEPYRVNERIRSKMVRVIGENGKQLGVMDKRTALEIAREKGLDLVEIVPEQNPPVCKTINYGKFKYEIKKKEKASKRKQSGEIKEISFRPTTSEHDLNIKLKKAKEFIEDGYKVKVRLYFKGREKVYFENGYEVLDNIFEQIKEWAEVENKPKPMGRQLVAIIKPVK